MEIYDETHLTTMKDGCFPPGTLVLMADGSVKPIESITPGDQVLADNPTDAMPPICKSVVELHPHWTERLVHIDVDNNEDGRRDGSLSATREHAFWTQNRGWQSAKELRQGDVLQDDSGGAPRVLSIASSMSTTETFNITVDGAHTYFVLAGGTPLLVHNMNPGERLYIVYQVPDAQGKLYTGRASMSGAFGEFEPEDVLRRRFQSGHHRNLDFTKAEIRVALWGGGRGSDAYAAIRGAEQYYYEQAVSRGQATQQISPIRPGNPNEARYREVAEDMLNRLCP